MPAGKSSKAVPKTRSPAATKSATKSEGKVAKKSIQKSAVKRHPQRLPKSKSKLKPKPKPKPEPAEVAPESLIGRMPDGQTYPRYEPSAVRGVRFALPDGSMLQWSGPADHRLLQEQEFRRVAVDWAYIVRNRRRWAERDDTVDDQAQRACELLEQLGMSPQDRERLAFAGHVEVVIPWTEESVGWELRIFPWEYFLTAGTRDLRRDAKLSVVRRLESGAQARAVPATPRVLYVQSAIGALAERYDFGGERAIVQANLKPQIFESLINPTRDELEDKVRTFVPDIIHLAGFDTHQGLSLLKKSTADEEARDGYLLRGTTGAPDPVTCEALANALTSAATPPALVTCNLHNSAGRIAPELLAAGVGSAIGFQDTFDDGLAELFFGSFYHALMLADGDLVMAFDSAWEELREQPRSVQGSGLVLWSNSPMIEPATSATSLVKSAFAERISHERAQLLLPDSTTDLSEVLQVTVEPLREANYSLLHNNRGLFKRFVIQKLKPGRLDHLRVSVELHVGADTYPYRRSFSLKDGQIDLNDLVRVPLTSALARSRHEAMFTSLFVEVAWGVGEHERQLYRDTHRVIMLPADQWRDDDADRVWLPSFVLPRDPAVARIIERAQRYLMALRDDPSAGFDGYQSLDDNASDPSECVDLQVQAIWSAIVYDFQLSYINPPPAYSEASQRIRTPSEIIASAHGTCLDLTLLLAACLEFIEIYPVVFLLKGHAFPGYWRSDSAHASFVEVTSAELGLMDAADAQRATRTAGQREAWYVPKQSWPEMIKQVRAGDLVPLESVWLTSHRGFWDAVDAGHENLGPRGEFDALLDVSLARSSGVTPLPIREEVS